VSALLDGLAAVLGAMATSPALVRLFPGLAATPADAALAQWASCGALGGTPVRALGSDAVDAALPWAPEFCGWAQSVMGVSRAEAALPLPAAQTFLATLRSSAPRMRACHAAVRSAADVACVGCADPQFAEQMTHFPPETLAPVLNVTAAHARLLLGCARARACLRCLPARRRAVTNTRVRLLRGRSYVNFIAFTYAKQAFSKLLGPPLGPASSGPIVGRTYEQWHFGFSDPVLASLLPRNASAPWWSYDDTSAPRGRRIAEAPRWAALAAEVGAGVAPPGAAERFFTTGMATGRPGEHMAQTGDIIADNGAARVAHPGGSTPVAGRAAGPWGFGDLSALPFGLADRQPAQWYLGRWDMSPDPGSRIGLGRPLPLTWQGRPAYMDHYVPSLAYALDADTLTPCGGAAPNASAAAHAAAALACVYGDDIAGVWNLSAAAGAPLFITRGHFYGADPSLAASLGPDGAAAMAPDEAAHNIAATLDTLFGLPLALRASFQTVVGLRPTAVFFPRLWHGAPGPGGYTFLPASWLAVRVVPSDQIVRLLVFAALDGAACALRALLR
jgi:hypothetical protein